MTVDEAEHAVSELTGDAAKVASLIAACLNAEAALHMMGCKSPKRSTGFLPVGVQTLVQIEDLLATMPNEVALVKASMAFSCECCGRPAEISSDDCWICEACYTLAAAAPETTGFAELADEKRPAQATGNWEEAWADEGTTERQPEPRETKKTTPKRSSTETEGL